MSTYTINQDMIEQKQIEGCDFVTFKIPDGYDRVRVEYKDIPSCSHERDYTCISNLDRTFLVITPSAVKRVFPELAN